MAGVVVGGLLISPIGAAPATAAPEAMLACSAFASYPTKSGSTVTGQGGLSGTSCGSTKVTVLLKRARTGPDQVLKEGSRNGSGTVTLYQACDWAGTWGIYTEAFTAGSLFARSSTRDTSC